MQTNNLLGHNPLQMPGASTVASRKLTGALSQATPTAQANIPAAVFTSSAAMRKGISLEFRCPETNIEEARNRYTEVDEEALREMGLLHDRAETRRAYEIPAMHTVAFLIFEGRRELIGTDEDFGAAIEQINQLARMFESSANAIRNMPGATAQQRGVQREATVRMASYFAENHFSNEEAAATFIRTIQRMVGNDSMDDGHRANVPSDWGVVLGDLMSEESIQELFGGNLPRGSMFASSPSRHELMTQRGYLDLGRWMFNHSTNSFTRNIRNNFDTLISSQQFASTSQWMSDMQGILDLF